MPVQLVPRAMSDPPGPLGLRAIMVQPVHKVSRVNRVFKGMLDLLVLPEQPEQMDPQAQLVLLAPTEEPALPDRLALPALRVRLDLPAPRVLRVMLDLRAPKAFKVSKAFKATLVPLGRQVLVDRPALPVPRGRNHLLLDPPDQPDRRVAQGRQGRPELRVMPAPRDPREMLEALAPQVRQDHRAMLVPLDRKVFKVFKARREMPDPQDPREALVLPAPRDQRAALELPVQQALHQRLQAPQGQRGIREILDLRDRRAFRVFKV